MLKIIYQLNEQVVQPAVNQREVQIELNFDVDDPNAEGTVTVNNWDFSVLEAKIINQHITDGLTGGVGIYEGIPFKIDVEDDAGRVSILDAYLDIADSESLFEVDRVKTVSKLRGGVDWLNDRADNVTYNILFSKGEITTADYISVPYVISSIPDRQSIVMLTLSSFVIVIEIKRTVKDFADLVVELNGVFTTLPAIVKLVVFIVYLIFLIIALVKLIKDLVNSIIQPVKYHTGMKLLTLLEKGAEHLGMTFESSIFDSDPFWQTAIILPAKFNTPPDKTNGSVFGNLRPRPTIETGYFEGSFGDLLRICKTIFNAKILSSGNVIKLERVDTNTSTANYVLPNVEQKIKGTNAHEIAATYNIKFPVDFTDTNTIDDYEGTATNIVTLPIAINNKDMVLLRGLQLENMSFSRGSRKKILTAPEKFFNAILKVVGKLLGNLGRSVKQINKGNLPQGGIGDLISNRIGMLKLSDDYFTNDKLIGYDLRSTPIQNKVSLDNAIKIHSEYLWDNFHIANSFVPDSSRPNANQWLTYSTEMPFTKEDFLKVKNNNLIFDSLGNIGKIESLTWTPFTRTAKMTFRINQLFTLNLDQNINTPDGQ